VETVGLVKTVGIEVAVKTVGIEVSVKIGVAVKMESFCRSWRIDRLVGRIRFVG
jgi:hypothetical protein